MPKVSAQAIERLLTHNVVEVIDRAHLHSRLVRGERLRVKLGIDPTAPDIHLGFAVVLQKLRAFQDLGHMAVLIIGDATARVGDPSGRPKTRPVLHHGEILANEKTYLQQAGKIIDLPSAEVRHNNEWFRGLSFADLVNLLQKFTVARILERDDFQKRLKARSPIGLHELIYPVLQAYDSVAVKADVEIGGTDQTFNLLTGRDLQPHFNQPTQDVLTTRLLVGLDGREKMSKSLGNAVGITDPSDEMLGKLMTIPDAVIPDYARLAADWPEDRVVELHRRLKKENPRDLKLEMARDTVAAYHGAEAAKRAADEWLRVFHNKELPADIPEKKIALRVWDTAELLVATGLASSKSEAKRLLAQGGAVLLKPKDAGVPFPINILPYDKVPIEKGDIIRVGKRKFVKLV